MPRTATLLIIGGAIILATVLAATGLVSASSVSVGVEITETGFSPNVVTISPHSTVTWTNAGSQSHSVVGESGSALESPTLAPRFAYSYTFHSTGTFAYYDATTQMKGLVIVLEGAVAAPPAQNISPLVPSSTPLATPATEGQSAVPADIPSSGNTPSFRNAEAASAGTSIAARSGPETAAEPEPEPQGVSSASETSVQLGSEWFGEPAYQGGVFETIIEPGGLVQWTVVDGIHNIYECGENWTKTASCAEADWKSAQIISAGDIFVHTFDSPGRFFYMCTIHPATMRGVVSVEAPSAPSDSNPPSSSNPPADSQTDQAPTVSDVAGIPSGGGPPLNPGDGRLIMILVGAAIAFVISTLTFVGGGVRAKK